MRQVTGRGLRTPDEKCQVYILVDRYKALGAFVPERFQESWVEGDIQVYLQAEAKRMRGYRKKALEDLRPLCANCHELAHSESPPITIERLKAMEGS